MQQYNTFVFQSPKPHLLGTLWHDLFFGLLFPAFLFFRSIFVSLSSKGLLRSNLPPSFNPTQTAPANVHRMIPDSGHICMRPIQLIQIPPSPEMVPMHQESQPPFYTISLSTRSIYPSLAKCLPTRLTYLYPTVAPYKLFTTFFCVYFCCISKQSSHILLPPSKLFVQP